MKLLKLILGIILVVPFACMALMTIVALVMSPPHAIAILVLIGGGVGIFLIDDFWEGR